MFYGYFVVIERSKGLIKLMNRDRLGIHVNKDRIWNQV